jgi:hypothetical protein
MRALKYDRSRNYLKWGIITTPQVDPLDFGYEI